MATPDEKKPGDAASKAVAVAPLEGIALRVQDEGLLPEAWTLRLLPQVLPELGAGAAVFGAGGLALVLSAPRAGSLVPDFLAALAFAAACWVLVVGATRLAVGALAGSREGSLGVRLGQVARVAAHTAPLLVVQVLLGGLLSLPFAGLALASNWGSLITVGITFGGVVAHGGGVAYLVRRALLPGETVADAWGLAHFSLVPRLGVRLLGAWALDAAGVLLWGVSSMGLVFQSGMGRLEYVVVAVVHMLPLLLGTGLATLLMAHTYTAALARDRVPRIDRESV